MNTLERSVAVRGVGVMVVTLLLLGVATAGLLHWRDGAALDRALIVAAHGGAGSEGWSLDHAPPPIETRTLTSGDPRSPPERVELARRSERPVFFEQDGRRGVLLVIERNVGGHEQHRLIEATAQEPEWWATTGPFLLAYVPLATAAAALSGVGLTWLVRRAMAPLASARREASAILTFGSGRRLTEEGPDELRALVGAINGLLDRLEVAHEAQARFTAEAAHELRTPVTSMMLALDLALRHPRTSDQYREALASTREEVVRLQRLVQGLVVLARLDGGVEVAATLRPVRELVREAIAAEQAPADSDGVGDERVVVHPELVSIALRNLLRNAVRHAPGSALLVRTRPDGDRVRIEVDDRGPGIAVSDRERVFDRLARLGEARRQDPDGLGLGLPMAREIARREGGDCTLEEADGGGVRAVLSLPRA